MKIWILTDDRIGSNNQSIAIGNNIGGECIIKKVVYNKYIKIPNFIRQNSLIGIDKNKSDDLTNDLPDVVICAGRRLSSVALNIKKQSNGKTFVINIMNPNLNFGKFDLIILPKHDNTKDKILKKYKNVIETDGTLNLVNKERIENETNKWFDTFKDYKKPIVSLIIGGDTKDYKFDSKQFGLMVKQLSEIINNLNGSLFITTSRRTSDNCLKEIKENLKCEYYLYDWKEDSKNNNVNNPYFAFLGISDFLIATGDSMSMVSECCSTGKPTYIYMPENSIAKKHRRFCENLIKNGVAKEFNSSISSLEIYNYTPLNEVEKVVDIIKSKIYKK